MPTLSKPSSFRILHHMGLQECYFKLGIWCFYKVKPCACSLKGSSVSTSHFITCMGQAAFKWLLLHRKTVDDAKMVNSGML